MKVGIMSMQRIINYGSFLQAYGLKKTIESLGNEVIFVDYRVEKPLIDNNYTVVKRQSKLIRIFKVICSPSYRKKRYAQICENQSFNSFSATFKNDWLPMLKISDDKVYNPNLDVLVIGSDEVFNCTQSNSDVGYSLDLFGKNNNADKVISYAASFGSTTLDKLNKYNKSNEIAECLKRFDAISVRDNNSHSIVKKLTNIEPADNVDPVLISDYDDEVSQIKIDMKDYVIVYAYSGRINDEEAEAIQNFAHRRNKKTLSIGVRQAFTDEYVCVNPFEMLAYFKNADYVITDTFHGTVFSIKYQIPFATIIRESNKEKLSDLLNKFNLSSRKLTELSAIDKVIDSKFDKEEIKVYIEKYRSQAYDYLKNNISL
jgi:hypothetical protein